MMKRFRIAAGIIAASMTVATPFIIKHEGNKLEAYEDVVGVWTVCAGVAYVPKNTKYTKEQCDKINATTIGKHMDQVAKLVKVPMSPRTLAAHTSLHYNIGDAAYARSTALKLTNSGNMAEGCNAFLKWKIAGGKDCSIKSNNCYGLWNRRQEEKKLCIAGLNDKVE
jgi:lysozyme